MACEQKVSAGRIDFIYVGLPKAGSTWLYQRLRDHEQLFIPFVKETYYFDRNYHKGVEWYLSQFDGSPPLVVKGEICHNYLYGREVAERIYDSLGELRIMAALREPLDWFVSDYRYALRNGTFKGGPNVYFRDRFDPSSVAYSEMLQRFVARFGKDKVLVLFYEELVENPQRYMDRVTEFLGVRKLELDGASAKPVNSAAVPRSRRIAFLVKKSAKALRKLGFTRLIYLVKTSRFTSLLYKTPSAGQKESLLNEMDSEVVEYFREVRKRELAELELMGFDTEGAKW